MLRIQLSTLSVTGRLLGTRPLALPIRDTIEAALAADALEKVEIDFEGTNPTQSFVDELIGVLVLEHGPKILQRLVMKNCTDSVKSILHFVVSARIDRHHNAHDEYA